MLISISYPKGLGLALVTCLCINSGQASVYKVKPLIRHVVGWVAHSENMSVF